MHRSRFRFALLSFLPLTFLSLAQAQGDPAQVGRWGSLIKAELVPIHVMLFPNGKLMYVDRHDQGTHDMVPRIWDPATNITIKAPNPGFGLFCAGHSLLRNGDVFFSGGHISDFIGENKLRIYNYRTNTWDAGLGTMYTGRWYPTNTTLPNGDVLIVSGSLSEFVNNPIPEIWDSRTRTLRKLEGAKQEIGLYPYMYVRPNDRVFIAGPDSMTRYLDIRGTGKWTDVGMTRRRLFRGYGSSVQYEPGKILICGGGEKPPSASVELIDLNQTAPTWNYADSMHHARRQHTATMLPDGNVVVIGGTSAPGFNNAAGAVYEAEMWDPKTGKWTVMAPAKTMRLYHSFSLLLPDARLLTGGGGHPGDDVNYLAEHPDFEIWEPPYLFKGTRPVIDAVPDTLYYGKTFALSTRNAGTLKVSLMRLAAITHSFDQNADFNRLTVQRESATSLLVTAPVDSAVTSPGPHMLFLLDSAGIPSVSKIVWVTSSSASGVIPYSGPRADRIGFAVAGNRLRVNGMDLDDGAKCFLINSKGERVADLKRISTGEFRLPDDRIPGTYIVDIRFREHAHSGMVFIP